MIGADELARMRVDVLDSLPDVCNILAASDSSDGMGGYSTAWGTAQANVKCRLDAASGSEQTRGGAVRPYYTYKLTLPYSTTITAAHRVVHGGVTYAVTSVDADKSWAIVKRAYVERV